MCSAKKVFLEISWNPGKHLCQSLFLNKVEDLSRATLLKKETLAQVFYCEFCEISTSPFSYKTPPVVASEYLSMVSVNAPKISCMELTSSIKQG